MRFWIFLCSLILSLTGFCQPDAEEPLERCNFNQDAIRKNKIRSVLVFAELVEDSKLEIPSVSGKAREYEFDSLGNVIYMITSYNDGYYPLAEYGRGSQIEFSEYNDQGQRTYLQRENFQLITEYIKQFDEDGNLVLSEIIFNGSGVSGHRKFSFEWKNGEMVKSEQLLPVDEVNKRSTKFDTKGQVLEYGTPSAKTLVTYKESGDTLTSTSSYYLDDTLFNTIVISELKQFEGQYAYFSSRDAEGSLAQEVSIVHDDQGNIVKYTREDHTMKDMFEDFYDREPEVLDIVNHYDNRGLLTKQEFYLTVNESIRKKLVRVYRYVYEENPLRFKFEKGELRAKEIEMNENDGRDY